MMGNFFNSMYYGKNRSDFTPDNLPKNRLELFFETLRVRLFKLVQLNLLMLPFALVFILCVWFFFYMVPANTPPEEIDFAFFYNIVISFCLYNIPGSMLFALGQVGMTYVARNWARDQHAWVWSDFKDALKDNWKQALLTGLLKGILTLGTVWAAFIYIQMYNADGNIMFFVLFWVMLMLMLVLSMADLFIWPMIITYELKLRHAMRNSVIIALARLPWSVLFLVLQALPAVLAVTVHPLIALYYLLIGFSLTTFINVSYTNASFDRLINPHIEGAPVNQGLRPDEEEEYEDDEE